MATTAAPNHRASLLAGLRTGGVRSTSGPMANVPHTAAPGGSFNMPRYVSNGYNGYNDSLYEEEDELADMMSQNLYINHAQNRMQQPMTAAVDGSANRFAHQQTMGMNRPLPMSPFMTPDTQAQLQALQLQMMQTEIARLQQQQYQAELFAQAQRQRQMPQVQPARRSAMPPASAGPTSTSFDLRSATMRRAQQAEMISKLGAVGEEQVPMTASLGGRFGSRVPSGGYEEDLSSGLRNPPTTPSYTTVISGGTSLGGSSSNSNNGIAPSKSDAAVSWRRGGNNSVLSGNRTASAPVVKITPPPAERNSPPPSISPIKTRPQPLRFSAEISEPLTSVAIVTNDGTDGDDSSSSSSRSNSSPSTPRTASSMGDVPPLSPREEAAKKLYEGLGIGRPVPSVTVVAPPTAAMQRLASQPLRQPRGPPSNNEELVPKNFATRSRRKAIGALLDARERREVVEAY
ncbi:unnamed protein product [Somion occarium]|uniref:Uncharacterized protein n=1 Tax=Somion occarium TaxID=3059160 RepID=A0ABP1D5P1_9APHY